MFLLTGPTRMTSSASFEEALLERQICFKPPKDSETPSIPVHAPVTLNPTPFSKIAFNRALQLQFGFNLLVLRTIQNAPLLKEVCSHLAQSDEFVAKLFQIYLKYPEIPKIFFNINRSDYMVEGSRIFQIELNTISASLAGLSTKLTELQREFHPKANIPVNRACYGIGEAFNQAVMAYKNKYRKDGAVLFIVQEGERNFYDQLHLQNSIDPSIPVLRHSLKDPSVFKVSDSDGTLRVNDQEVAVVYYRAGYSPDEYKTPDFWVSRELLESSRAIKCPDIASHLAGLKKIQQVLTSYDYLLKTMKNDQIMTEELQSCFAGIYSLDVTEEGEKNAAMACADPEKFVLKPQREGGGNNFYGQQIRTALQSMSPQERSAFILMDRIRPSITPNCQIIRSSQVKEINALSELGVYGTILAKGDEILSNEQVGWLLRTKPEESDEGGVVSGYSVLDVPNLE